MRPWQAILCVLIVFANRFLYGQHCDGTERWAVKDGTDAAAQQIDLSSSTPMTVAQLVQLAQPHLSNNNTTGIVPNETHLYRVTARLMQGGYRGLRLLMSIPKIGS